MGANLAKTKVAGSTMSDWIVKGIKNTFMAAQGVAVDKVVLEQFTGSIFGMPV